MCPTWTHKRRPPRCANTRDGGKTTEYFRGIINFHLHILWRLCYKISTVKKQARSMTTQKRQNPGEWRLSGVPFAFRLRKEYIMNNEEKILEVLAKLTAKVDRQGDQLTYLTERVDEIDTRSLRSSVLLETEVARDVRLVYEGQEMLRQKMEELAPKDRVEVLEGDVAMLKDVIKLMRQEIAELKKAQ